MKLNEINGVPEGKILVNLDEDNYEIMTHEELKKHMVFKSSPPAKKINKLLPEQQKKTLYIDPDYGMGPYIWQDGSNLKIN